jgi:hypothetical protein
VKGLTGIFGGVTLASPGGRRASDQQALANLRNTLPVLYSYMDSTLALKIPLHTHAENDEFRQFERVLHPIFEEDD